MTQEELVMTIALAPGATWGQARLQDWACQGGSPSFSQCPRP